MYAHLNLYYLMLICVLLSSMDYKDNFIQEIVLREL